MQPIRINWTLCKTYEAAKDFRQAIYLHEWSAEPFYWGMLGKSKFGGNRQEIEGGRYLNPRYGSSYKHWIEGCLRHGAILYIGTPEFVDHVPIQMIERQLIHNYPSTMNAREESQGLIIEHHGDVPLSILTKKP